jgi:hypothetical protein
MNRAAICIGLYSLVISLLCSTRASSQGILGKPVEPWDKKPANLLYSEHYGAEVCMNTPRIHGSQNADDVDWVMIYVKINSKGIWESFRVGQLSKLQKLDFWTIWATATCPPIYPSTELSFPTDATVGNKRDCGESTADEEFCRNSLGKLADSLKNDDEIVFPLIPVSIAGIYPNTFSKEELLSINNLVAIPTSLLPKKAEWTEARANEWIKSGPLKDLLREWHGFFIANEKPSRADISNFAQRLKKKYQKVLKQAEEDKRPPLPKT